MFQEPGQEAGAGAAAGEGGTLPKTIPFIKHVHVIIIIIIIISNAVALLSRIHPTSKWLP